jgi:hypothetical protein
VGETNVEKKIERIQRLEKGACDEHQTEGRNFHSGLK